MKYFILCCTLFFIGTRAFAQNAHDANIRFGKLDRPGLLATFPYSKSIIETALKARFERAGFNRAKTDKGFLSYQAAKWAEMSPNQLDVYVKVDPQKGDKESNVILLISRGYDNYVSSTSDPELVAKLKAWMDSLLPELKELQHQEDIKAIEEELAKAERALKDAEDDQRKLTHERERLERKMAEQDAERQKRADVILQIRERLEKARNNEK